ncbi:MAG: hypothetical protein ACM3VZ_11695 [Acidobacteriota bacterium]
MPSAATTRAPLKGDSRRIERTAMVRAGVHGEKTASQQAKTVHDALLPSKSVQR